MNNKQTELEKAIERGERNIELQERYSFDCATYLNADIKQLIAAAKALSVLEDKCAEKDEALKECGQSLSTIKKYLSEYKPQWLRDISVVMSNREEVSLVRMCELSLDAAKKALSSTCGDRP